MAYCGQCGTQLNPNANFCGSCGAPVGGSQLDAAVKRDAQAQQADVHRPLNKVAAFLAGSGNQAAIFCGLILCQSMVLILAGDILGGVVAGKVCLAVYLIIVRPMQKNDLEGADKAVFVCIWAFGAVGLIWFFKGFPAHAMLWYVGVVGVVTALQGYRIRRMIGKMRKYPVEG